MSITEYRMSAWVVREGAGHGQGGMHGGKWMLSSDEFMTHAWMVSKRCIYEVMFHGWMGGR